MKAIKFSGSQDTPKVVLDKDAAHFEISGKSFPADVTAFYEPIIDWLDSYSESPLEKTVFILKMDYFNTASSKIILDILYKLEDLSSTEESEVLIKWYYPDDDEDMQETGEEYDEIVDVDFELIEYKI